MRRGFLIRRLPVFVLAALLGGGLGILFSGGGDTGAQLTGPGFDAGTRAPRVLPSAVRHKPVPRADAAADTQAVTSTRPVIAICIDDLGMDLAGTKQAIALPRDIALAFLPYAPATPELAQAAAAKGHLILAHVPMQPLNGRDPGPMGLKPGMTEAEITQRLAWNLSRVPHLAGVNNHEGSQFTSNAHDLRPVMTMLKARGLFFFDSRTVASSVGAATARAVGVKTGTRDVFLDDDPSPVAIGRQLAALVREAQRTGIATAIGHPRATTMRVLAAWLAQDHGVMLVPLDRALRIQAARGAAAAIKN